MRNHRRGFTIVEILIVIVIIGILAAISVVVYSGITEKARHSKAAMIVNSYVKLINLHKAKYGDYPNIGEGRSTTYACLGLESDYPEILSSSGGSCYFSQGSYGAPNTKYTVNNNLNSAFSSFGGLISVDKEAFATIITDGGAGMQRGILYFSPSPDSYYIVYNLTGNTKCPVGSGGATNLNGKIYTNCSLSIGS